MQARLSSVFIATLLAAPSTWALGINCKGSSKCGDQPKDTLQRIYDLIETQIDPNFFFPDGRQIACANSVCAFLQKSQGASGQVVKDILDDLKNHSCQVCGSVPTLYRNGTNDVNKGELTLNFVDQACGDATAPCLGMLPQYQ
ncbi:killer toxin, kp4 [Exidia glandulosa HHB12029]|uniref:Killer toxin, kp4 n=1 Tax=Exidia glandulosa HHB12029 TaxID=1314781 RepID=A0A165P2S8_EXIGL|nr:killer toxin, kp4 [Exidia glandulosa HHB12029]